MDLNEKNFAAIEIAINQLSKQHMDLSERMKRLENTLTILQQEMNNQKQLTAHVLGRGMGSTVNH